MKKMSVFAAREYESFDREGVEKPRSYYIPFGSDKQFEYRNGILNRQASDRFMSLDGEWEFRAHDSLEQCDPGEQMNAVIPVPSCVQMHGYDQIQYLNTHYAIPVDPPYVRVKNPAFHYRRSFTVSDTTQRYYLNFEGVDSFFYVYINGKRAGYSQITHATSEFDVTPLISQGDNIIDVIVLKWSAGTYLECQDKFRFTGIIRSVYILRRPQKHITDFALSTTVGDSGGSLTVRNDSSIALKAAFLGQEQTVAAGKSVNFTADGVQTWTAENPELYDLVLSAEGEKILQRVGFRSSRVQNGVYCYNGKPLKLMGVNRHEFSPTGGATVTVDETLRDLELMKWANVNAIRTCHYPDSPEFYDLCDAMGFYVMDEADVETHGMADRYGSYGNESWQEFADSGIADKGVTDREITLYERDKNRTCVVMWSLGNESSYGKMFHAGADYIHARDSRPVYYEGAWNLADKSDYYTHRIDLAGRMYPSIAEMKEFLLDGKEKRPLLLCEYSHAMGNSNGDLNDYWNLIDGNERFAGAFVWEWRDHAILTESGYKYGGDFGENEHDGNFCVDGLLNPDWTPKSGLYEMRAVYGGKRGGAKLCKCAAFDKQPDGTPLFELGDNGELIGLGGITFAEPLQVNVFRAYIDNDSPVRSQWQRCDKARQTAYDISKSGNRITVCGKMTQYGFAPVLDFTLVYDFFDGGVDITLDYVVPKYVEYLPRIGLMFAVAEKNAGITYKGYGPHESYIDKNSGSEYGEYESSADKEYFHYVKPQESGSHYGSTVLKVCGMTVTAEKPFSFSVLPYSAQTLASTGHDYELPESNATYVSLDVAMSGVGTNSCGPKLDEKYRAPKKGANKFRIMIK